MTVLYAIITDYFCITPIYEITGNILCSEGPIMAASDKFDITVYGKGGHGAVPQVGFFISVCMRAGACMFV